jgi:outer membrane lipoprotein SlyB
MASTADTSTTTRSGPLASFRRVPIWVWLIGAIGAIGGALLAEPGDFWGNTVPSTLTFLVAGLLVAFAVWGLTALVRR